MAVRVKEQGLEPRFIYFNKYTLNHLETELFAEMGLGVENIKNGSITNVNGFDIIVCPWLENWQVLLTDTVIYKPMAFETLR